MNSNFSWLATMAVFSGLSMNLILQFGIGLNEVALGKITISSSKSAIRFLLDFGFLFIAIFVLWIVMSVYRTLIPVGFFEYVIIFPLCLIGFYVFEYFLKRSRYLSKIEDDSIMGNIFIGGSLCGCGLFITLKLAGGFLNAIVLSFGFSAGTILALAIIREIRMRSNIQAVPHIFRGAPLMLISMGLLSLLFTSAALMFYQTMGAN